MAKRVKKIVKEESFDKYTLPTPKKSEETHDPVSVVEYTTIAGAFWSGRGKLWLGIILICLVVATVSGMYIFSGINVGQNTIQNNQISTETTQVTPTPTTQPAELDKTALKIEILNGVGVPGTAAVTKSYLENLGYTNITTGNADNYNFKTTVIETKENMKNYGDLLIKDLSGKYKTDILPTFLDEASEFDVVITIGTN